MDGAIDAEDGDMPSIDEGAEVDELKMLQEEASMDLDVGVAQWGLWMAQADAIDRLC